MTALEEKVLALHRGFTEHNIPHAIGGAIALAYAVGQARATHDVDVNVFVPIERADEVVAALAPDVGVGPDDAATIRRDGQVRLRWDDNPVDLFFSTVELHDVAATRALEVPFARSTIPILSATDLTVCKALYGRGRDWVDIEAMRDVGTVDASEALGWVARMLGRDHAHYRRLYEILTSPPVDDDTPPRVLRPGGR